MKKHVTFSNILFVIAIVFVLYTPTRIWIISKLSFSPSIEKIEDNKVITNFNWGLKGLNTSDINFSELKGKVIFLNFWATWCPPCVAELPYIDAFYKDYKDKVAFIFISNENKKEIEIFFKKEGFNFPVYQSKNTSLEGLPIVKSIPRTFVIDAKGNIRVDKSGAADWNSNTFRKQINLLLAE